MRSYFCGLVLVALGIVPFGCHSKKETQGSAQVVVSQNEAPHNRGAPANDITKQCNLRAGGKDILRLTVPADTKCMADEGSLKLDSRERRVELWMVRGAQSVADAIGRVPQEIRDEFKDFKPESTSDLTVAGTAAKRMFGVGTEADDGDPGHADVVVFKSGDRVFVACVHGEHMSSAEREWMIAILQTAKSAG